MKQKIARLISNVFFNPGVLALVVLVIAIIHSPMSQMEKFCWLVGVVVLNGVIPGLFYLFFTSRGFVFDDTLHNQKVHRERILLIGLFLVLATLELLILISAERFYQPFLAVLVSGVIAITISGVISYFWKISMHSSMVTFFVLIMLLLFSWQNWWPIILIVPLAWWSRLVLHRHTIWQLIGGLLMSSLIISLVFWYFGLI